MISEASDPFAKATQFMQENVPNNYTDKTWLIMPA